MSEQIEETEDVNRLTDVELDAEIDARYAEMTLLTERLSNPALPFRLQLPILEQRKLLTREVTFLKRALKRRMTLKAARRTEKKQTKDEKWYQTVEGRTQKSYLFLQAAMQCLEQEKVDEIWLKARENFPALDWESAASVGKYMPWNRNGGSNG